MDFEAWHESLEDRECKTNQVNSLEKPAAFSAVCGSLSPPCLPGCSSLWTTLPPAKCGQTLWPWCEQAKVVQDTHLQLVVRFRKREERGRRDELLVQPSAKSFVNATSAGVTKTEGRCFKTSGLSEKGNFCSLQERCMYVRGSVCKFCGCTRGVRAQHQILIIFHLINAVLSSRQAGLAASGCSSVSASHL